MVLAKNGWLNHHYICMCWYWCFHPFVFVVTKKQLLTRLPVYSCNTRPQFSAQPNELHNTFKQSYKQQWSSRCKGCINTKYSSYHIGRLDWTVVLCLQDKESQQGSSNKKENIGYSAIQIFIMEIKRSPGISRNLVIWYIVLSINI